MFCTRGIGNLQFLKQSYRTDISIIKCVAYATKKNSKIVYKSIPREENYLKGAYYAEFIKLLKKQKDLPFIYSAANSKLNHVELPFLKHSKLSLKPYPMDENSFSGLGIKPSLIKTLIENHITEPLPVQKRSLPVLLKGKRAIIESVTGSGKTLAFLLPILQDVGNKSCSNIIIVPTRELASQIYKEVLKYVEDKNIVSRHVSGINIEHEKKLSQVLHDSKILIGTPKKLLEIIEENTGHFRHVKRVIVDEVDKILPLASLFNQKVGTAKTKPTEKILAILTHYRKSIQFIATSATISPGLVQELQDIGFSKHSEVIKLVPHEYKHGKVPENIKHYFTVVPDGDQYSKLKFCARLFKHSKEKSVLIFIDRGESVERIVDEFKEMGFSAVALYKELLLPAPITFETFTKNFQDGDIQIVVATEETMRGLDFPFVNQLYLTYVPITPERYLHVAGRVGRLDNSGIVTTVIGETNAKVEKKHLKKRLSVLGIKGRQLNI